MYTPTSACDAGVYYGAKCTSAKVKLTSLWPPSLTTLSFIILLNIVSPPVPLSFRRAYFLVRKAANNDPECNGWPLGANASSTSTTLIWKKGEFILQKRWCRIYFLRIPCYPCARVPRHDNTPDILITLFISIHARTHARTTLTHNFLPMISSSPPSATYRRAWIRWNGQQGWRRLPLNIPEHGLWRRVLWSADALEHHEDVC